MVNGARVLCNSKGKPSAKLRRNHLPFTIRHSPLLIFQPGECSPARIRPAALAGALARVQVRAALRAEALALFAAESARREREHDLLAHKLVQINRVALVGREAQVRRMKLDVLGLHGLRLPRDEGRVELDFQRQPYGGEAAVAREVDLGAYLSA